MLKYVRLIGFIVVCHHYGDSGQPYDIKTTDCGQVYPECIHRDFYQHTATDKTTPTLQIVISSGYID